MYPKSKSQSELKYERLRGMCSGAWENVRYIPIDNGIQSAWQGMAVAENGRTWRYMVGAVCISVYSRCRNGTAGKEARYTNATRGIPVYDMRTQYTPAITRTSQRPGACIACVRACVRALYYYIIIILLYYYIYIYPIYPIYPVYLIYPIYPTMLI